MWISLECTKNVTNLIISAEIAIAEIFTSTAVSAIISAIAAAAATTASCKIGELIDNSALIQILCIKHQLLCLDKQKFQSKLIFWIQRITRQIVIFYRNQLWLRL